MAFIAYAVGLCIKCVYVRDRASVCIYLRLRSKAVRQGNATVCD
uniref:Uncharacterized protein n=1 Tax=Anguilla anguilla TaxID=7936 RepID=A0A0E9SDR2_ANGAN